MFNFLKRRKVQKERLKQVITKDRKETEKENKIKQKTKKWLCYDFIVLSFLIHFSSKNNAQRKHTP